MTCSCFHVNQRSRLCHTRMTSYTDRNTTNTPRGQPTLTWLTLRWSWFGESTHYHYQVYLCTGNACCPRDRRILTTSLGSRESSCRTANRFTVPPMGVALSRATTSSWLFPFRSTPLTCTHVHRAEWIEGLCGTSMQIKTGMIHGIFPIKKKPQAGFPTSWFPHLFK